MIHGGTYFQVISIVKDDFEEHIESHGFYEDLHQAELNRDIISERLYIGTDSEDYSVFINEIKI